MSDLKIWLQTLGLQKYEDLLAEHDIDLTVVPDLTERDLEKLGFSLGHLRKFMAAAAKLRAAIPSAQAAPAHNETARQPVSERRQITVSFVDLVSSTVLGSHLDPEDLISLLRRYREVCVATIARHEGFIAQYLGDGILVYFGFPQAQEDAAERAVRAGLEIAERVAQLKQPDGSPLQVRVGIATGLVVVSEAVGVGVAGEETVVGDTPNLAARLQSYAEPGGVLVGPTTHRLTADFFEYVFAGEHVIKGFQHPVRVWKAIRESATESRFAASHAATTGPILGRDRELAFLEDAWARATQNNGHVVLIEGEPGIGKSRLVEALVEHVRSSPHRLLRGQCSPYHRNSVLFPFRTLLWQMLDIDHNASANEIIVRITCLVGEAGRRDRASTLLLAELLEVPTEDQLPPAAMTPNQRRDETLAILEDLVLRARNGPVLLVLEDAHWSDLTTQTLVERLLKRVDRERALVLLTYRPELKTDWRKHPNATFIACKQIGHEQCAALIQNVASGMQMDPVLIEEIIARSDGVPLFVEELTKAVLDLHTPDAGAVPLTLRDSLMARLDRLGPPKEIAQIASVLGRQFTFEALKAVAATNDSDLHAALAKLREAGLVYELERNCDDGLSFNHSLVQEAAYDSLPRGRRRILHSQVARYLEAQSAAAGDPTLIAYHFGRAAEPAKSVHYWLEAADQASRRVALAESAANLGAALDEAERISDPQLRKRLMLDAQLKLSATIAIHKGPHSDEAQSSLEKAEALARETGEGAKLFQAVWGLYLNAARNRRYSKAKQRGDELLRISRDLNDRDLQYEALHHQWGYAYFIGRTADILSLTAEGVRNYNRARHHRFSYVYAGHDPGVCAHCVRALGLGLAGHGREVRPTLNTGLALANELEHPLTLAFFHSVACFAMYLADDADGCQEFAEELIKVSTKYDLAATRAVGSFVTGASLGLRGDVTAALKQMEPSFEPTLTYGFMGVLPGVIMIEMLNRVGRSQEALALAIRLLDDLPDPEAAVFVSELWRLRGELRLVADSDKSAQALTDVKIALRIAENQGAAVYRLRAAVSAARLFAETGERERAKSILDQVKNLATARSGPDMAAATRLRSDLN